MRKGIRHHVMAFRRYALLLLFLGWCLFLANSIHRVGAPIISAFAKEHINHKWNAFLAQILPSAAESTDFVTITTSADGKTQSILINTQKLHQFKSEFIDTFLDYSEREGASFLKIPIGTLSRYPLLYGKGPMLTVELLPCTDITVEVKDRFESAGINQTLHSLIMEVTAHIVILTPGGSLDYCFTDRILLSQTWIVGSTPSVYPMGGLLP